MLDGLMVDCVNCIPFAVMAVCVRNKVYFLPHISDGVVMHAIVKGGIFEFICCVHTKNGIVFCEFHQD